MTKKEIYDLLNAEIEWCRNDQENENMQEDFRLGFIEGLTQAKRLVRVAYGIDEWLKHG